MPNLVRALRPGRSAGGQHRLVLLVSSVTAAAGLSLTQVLIRRRSTERGNSHRRRYRIGPRRTSGHELGRGQEVRRIAADQPNHAVERRSVEPQREPDPGADRSKMPEIRSQLPAWPLPPDRSLAILGPGLRRIYRRGRRAEIKLRKKPTDERWRELRKRSKDLWYLSQVLESAAPKRMRKVTGRARRLSDLLREDRDLARLDQRIRGGHLDQKDVKVLSKLIARRRRALQRKAHRVARRLYREKPRTFARRLSLD